MPLALLLLLVLLLFVTILAQGQPKAKAVILGVLILPVCGLFFESFFRRISIAADQITMFKPFRQKNMVFADVTSVDTIQVKKRAFLTLSTEEDFLIISNAYADFPSLVRELLEKVPAKAITEETAKMAEAPPNKSSDIVSCWFAVILMTIILVLQFV